MAPSSSTLHSSSPTDTSSNGNRVTKPVSPLWRLDTIPGKGKGLISTQNITPGTLILSDSPLITTECITSIETTEKDLARALKALPKDRQREFLSLHNNYPGKGSPLSNIVRSNGYPLGPGSEVGGVFPNVSRINHSCRPNAKHTWNEKLKQQTVYAIRPIAEGEELYLSYLAGGTSEERKETLKEHFGFDCTCELCSLPPAQLQKSDHRIIRSQDLHNKIGDPDLATSNPGKLMALGKRLLGIYREESILDDRLPNLYYDFFQICNMHGDLARASAFAKRYVELKVVSEGPDSTNAMEVEEFVKDPRKYKRSETQRWRTSVDEIPRDLGEEAFEKWLWRESV